MANVHDIEVPRGIELCPGCGELLIIETVTSGQLTRCNACSYREPAGAIHAVALLSSTLERVANNMGVHYALLNGELVKARMCFASRGLLPLFVERADNLVRTYGLGKMPMFDMSLFCQPDPRAALNCRVVIRKPVTPFVVPGMALLLTEVLVETMELTRKLSSKYSPDTICVNYIPGIAAGQTDGVADSPLMELLRKAGEPSFTHRENTANSNIGNGPS